MGLRDDLLKAANGDFSPQRFIPGLGSSKIPTDIPSAKKAAFDKANSLIPKSISSKVPGGITDIPSAKEAAKKAAFDKAKSVVPNLNTYKGGIPPVDIPMAKKAFRDYTKPFKSLFDKPSTPSASLPTVISPILGLVDDEILRDFNFELIIFGEEDEPIVYRVRAVNIPSRSIEMMQVDFGGFRRNIPGRVMFEGKLNVTFEETEDLLVLTKLTNTFNMNHRVIENSEIFLASTPNANSVTKIRLENMVLKLYKYGNRDDRTGLPKEAGAIKFHNAILESMNSSQLSYSNNDSVKIEATFAFDYWTILPPG